MITYVLDVHYRKRGAIGVLQRGTFLVQSEAPIHTKNQALDLWGLHHAEEYELFYLESWKEQA